MAEQKTNVMRILDQKKIAYIPHEYSFTKNDIPDGEKVAEMIGKEPKEVYKTLVTVGASKKHYVFVIAVNGQLHLKKAAKAAGEKSIEMIKQKDLLALTGYVHGGCSPIGMKKPFKTFFQKEMLELKTVTLSAGKIGRQIELAPEDIIKAVDAATADVTA